jgi:hypothetical protein
VHPLIDSRDFDGITLLETRPFYGLAVCLRRPVKSVPFAADVDTPSTVEKCGALCSGRARPTHAVRHEAQQGAEVP